MAQNGELTTRGRPPVNPAAKRDQTIKFVVTRSERAALEDLATRKGCASPHEYARQIVQRHVERSRQAVA